MNMEKPSEPEGTLHRVLREMEETLDQNRKEIEGIKRQFPTIEPPKKYKDRLDALTKENADLDQWIQGIERQIEE